MAQQDRALEELSRIERYKRGVVELNGTIFNYVDACTMRGGYKEIFIDQAYKFYSRNPAPKIIDCGANIGISVLNFKSQFPDSRLIAFEADPGIYEFLKKNLDANHINGVDAINAAVWVNSEGVNFRKEGGFSGRIPKEGDENLIKIPSIRLKDYLNEPVELLKIDIEGAETNVIKDCSGALSFVDKLFIEYHSHSTEKQDLHELLAILYDQGFRYHIKNAFVRNHPFVNTNTMDGMDLQLNIYCVRNSKDV